MFEQAWGRVADGKSAPDGAPRKLDALAMLNVYQIYLAGPPVWLQRAISFAVVHIVRLFGYRIFRREYSPVGPAPSYHQAWRAALAPATRPRS